MLFFDVHGYKCKINVSVFCALCSFCLSSRLVLGICLGVVQEGMGGIAISP